MSTEGREQDLLDWIDGTLPADRKREIDAHLRGCSECRRTVTDLQALSAGLEALGPDQVIRRRRPLWWSAAAAAAIAALAGGAYLVDRADGPEIGRPQHSLEEGGLAVRLAAIVQPVDGPAQLTPADLAGRFERETELIAQLWLVVEIARSGDEAAARRVRAAVGQHDDTAPELLAAIDDFLPTTLEPGS